MAKFFTGKYATMYEKVKDAKSLESNKAILSSALDEVSSEMEGISGLIDQLEGSYASEVQVTFNQLITDVITTYNVITVDLEQAVSELEGLSSTLGEFKAKDEEYEKTDGELTTEQNRSVQKLDEENKVRTEWTNWQNKINDLKRALKDFRTEIERLMTECDTSMTNLDKFNDSVVSIRLKLASIAFAQQGIDPNQIANMTPEEKEKLMEAMVNAMTVKYEQYKKAYEDIVDNFLNSDNYDKASNLFYVYGLIMNDYSAGRFFEGTSAVNIGLALIDLVVKIDETKTSDGKSLLDCIKDYAAGKSFKDSGLLELYKDNRGAIYESFTDEEFEEDFNLSLQYDFMDKSIFESFANDLESVRKVADEFDKNYQLSLETGAAIKGLKELQDHIKYDSYYDSDEYKDFMNNGLDKWKDDAFLKEMEAKGFDIKKAAYMTSDELKMYEYLFETKGSDGAKEFADSINTSLTRREGYVKATEYYFGVKSGSNEGLDAALDAGSLLVTGYGDGLTTFVDGLVDLVAPSKELSVNEYAQVALLGYLANDDSTYGKAMLASYNIGEVAGKKTIPAVLNLVKPGAGTALEIASDTGNNLENYFRAEESTTYGEALLHAGLDLAGDKGIDAAAKAMGIDTAAGKLAVAATKSIFKQSVDSAYGGDDVSLFKLKDDLVKNMKGQLSGAVGEKLGGMWAEALNGKGFSNETVERITNGIIKPLSGDAGSVVVDAAYAGTKTAVEVGVDNAVNGANRDIVVETTNAAFDTVVSATTEKLKKVPEKLWKNKGKLFPGEDPTSGSIKE